MYSNVQYNENILKTHNQRTYMIQYTQSYVIGVQTSIYDEKRYTYNMSIFVFPISDVEKLHNIYISDKIIFYM